MALFFFFGCRSLYESLLAWEGGGMREELAETEKELAGSKGSKTKAKRALLSSSVLAETFVITVLAEWGDRSQIATIGLPRPRTRSVRHWGGPGARRGTGAR